MAELQGRVLKNYNGYYYLKVEGESEPYTCKVKGKMKKNRFSLATGDIACFEVSSSEKREGMITGVLPRRNFLPRPTLANLDLFVAAFACAAPDFSFLLADKLLALAELAKIPAILVLNKEDNAPAGLIEQVKAVYEPIGYEVYTLSAQNGTGVEALRERLRGKICAFGGPSGVGKSSTINAIDSSVDLRTGEVSEKIGRGKHTTRVAELLVLSGGGFVVDTPGFSFTEFIEMNPEDLRFQYREFRDILAGCHFSSCIHQKEPQCAVKNAVTAGTIAASRYESYCELLQEIQQTKRRF